MKAAKELLSIDKRSVYAVIGMLKTKDWENALKEILPALKGIVFVDSFAQGAVPKEELMQFARSCGGTASCEAQLSVALEKISEMSAGKDYAMITGSLYLASVMRKMITE